MNTLLIRFYLFLLFAFSSGTNINYGNVTCSDSMMRFDCKQTTTFVVICPQDCSGPDHYCNVDGTTEYRPTSSICCAAIHSGEMPANGGPVEVNYMVKPKRKFMGSNQNGVTSNSYYPRWSSYFVLNKYVPEQEFRNTTQKPNILLNIETTTEKKSEVKKENVNIEIATSFLTPTSTTNLEVNYNIDKEKFITESPIQQDESVDNSTSLISTETQHNYKEILYPSLVPPGIVVFIVFLVLMKRRIHRRRSPDVEKCVCYNPGSSSQQSLLNNPETCTRPCELKDTLITEAEDCNVDVCPISDKKVENSDCANCTHNCQFNQNFDF